MFAWASRKIVSFGKARHGGVRHRTTLSLQPDEAAWVWHLQLSNARDAAVPLDAIFVQDIGLAARGFLANSEAYASQYIDHHIADHPRYGPVLMCRQNLAQDGKHPWIAHGCLDGASRIRYRCDAALRPELSRQRGDRLPVRRRAPQPSPAARSWRAQQSNRLQPRCRPAPR